MKKMITTVIVTLAATISAVTQNTADETYFNSYLRFDLSSLATTMEIDSAKISVYRFRAFTSETTAPEGDNASTFYIQKALSNIPDSVIAPVPTPATQCPALYAWIMPFVDDETLDSFNIAPGYHDWITLNVSETVQDFIANPDNNKGFVLMNHINGTPAITLDGKAGSFTGYFSSFADTILSGMSTVYDVRPKISIWEKGTTEPIVFVTGRDGYGSNTLTNGTLEYGFYWDQEFSPFLIYCAVGSKVRFVGNTSYGNTTAISDISTIKKSIGQINLKASGELSLSKLKSGTYKVSIFSLQGKELASKRVNISETQAVTPVSFGKVADGMVICRIKGMGENFQKKIMMK